ncbi:MAG TPA: hypothetical protein VH682_02665 [Gemmataceae bacterium]
MTDRLVGQVNLNAVAVELDFVNPARSGRHFIDRGSQRWLDESGQWSLAANRRRLLPLKRHSSTPRNNRFKVTQTKSFRNPRVISGVAMPLLTGGANGCSEEENGTRTKAGPGPSSRGAKI